MVSLCTRANAEMVPDTSKLPLHALHVALPTLTFKKLFLSPCKCNVFKRLLPPGVYPIAGSKEINKKMQSVVIKWMSLVGAI